MKKTTFASILLLLMAMVANSQTTNPNNDSKKDPILTEKQLQRITKSVTPAVQIAYLDGDKVEHYNYGYKDISTKDPIDHETVFQAASLSKVVATYAFLALADKGLLDLDKPLWGYLEYDRLKDDPYKDLMTARHVLTHQTGLINWTKPRGSALKATFKPGTDYRYSGEAYYYLQMVAEKITGKSLNEICEEYIFQPFGMKKSRFSFTEELGENISMGHKDMESRNRVRKFKKSNAAFTMYTTAGDYMKFVIEGVLNGKGLSEEMHKEFLTPKVTTARKGREKEKDEYIKCCFGIRSMDNEAGRYYWHTGSNGEGFKCVFLVHPETGKAVTIFTNSNTGWDVNKPIFEAAFGKKQTYWLNVR